MGKDIELKATTAILYHSNSHNTCKKN